MGVHILSRHTQTYSHDDGRPYISDTLLNHRNATVIRREADDAPNCGWGVKGVVHDYDVSMLSLFSVRQAGKIFKFQTFQLDS